MIIVVNDASTDDTARAARAAGAVVVSHTVERGRASALETGVKVAAMRDRADWPDRLVLILSGDLGESAVEASSLVEAVMGGLADCAIAAEVSVEEPGRALAAKVARGAIRRSTGWDPHSPLSVQRCLTREATNAAMPFSNGYGLELGMTIDILAAGLSVVELPCAFTHLGSDRTLGELNRSRRYADTVMAATAKTLARRGLPHRERRLAARDQEVGEPYPRPAFERIDEGRAAAPDED